MALGAPASAKKLPGAPLSAAPSASLQTATEGGDAQGGPGPGLASELEQIMGEAVAALLDEDEAAGALEETITQAMVRQESSPGPSKRKLSTACSSTDANAGSAAEAASVASPVSSQSEFAGLLRKLALVEISARASKMVFADATAPELPVMESHEIIWPSGRATLKVVCRRKTHGSRGSCAVWFNMPDIDASSRLRLLCACVRWCADGRCADAREHFRSGKAMRDASRD